MTPFKFELGPLQGYGTHSLIVAGVTCPGCEVHCTTDGHRSLRLTDNSGLEALGKWPVDVLLTAFSSLTFPGGQREGIAYFVEMYGTQPGECCATAWHDTLAWKRPYSMAEYHSTLRRLAAEDGHFEVSEELADEGNGPSFGVETRYVISGDITLREHLNFFTSEVENLFGLAADEAATSVGTLTKSFHFPSCVAAACAQYLMYFGQFLEDVGIPTESYVTRRAGKVLLSVVPLEGREALERIHAALAIYLDLPGSNLPDAGDPSHDPVAVGQLTAAIHFLRGQLALAEATNRVNAAALDALQLSGSPEMQNRRTQTSGSQEEVLGGLVRITEYEGKGFVVNIPELFRRLKRTITGNE